MKKLLILWCLVPLICFAPVKTKDTRSAEELHYDFMMSIEFSEENLYELLVYLDAPNPEYAIKQCKLETGDYTSNLFVKHNNLFGMHRPRTRKTTSNGYVIADRGRKVCTYATWQDSVKDLMLYYEYYISKGYDPSKCYLTFLKNVGYCEDVEYYDKVLKGIKISKKIIKKDTV